MDFEKAIRPLGRFTPMLEKVPQAVRDAVFDIRISVDKPVLLCCGDRILFLREDGDTAQYFSQNNVTATREDVEEIFLRLCGYSVYSHMEEIRGGFVSADRALRVGIGGTAVIEKGGIKTVRDVTSLSVRIPREKRGCAEEVLRYGAKVLAEERIYGRELTVAVLGDRWLPAVETVPAGKEFDYVAKYQAGAAVETCPADVPPAVMQAAGELALRTHRALGLEVYSRTDMILDKDGNLWVLEANSLPGMTPNSFVPKEAAAVGMSYNQLCEEIVRLSCDVKRRG